MTRSGGAIVVLAAGRSTRMGTRNKLLLPWTDGKPVIRHVVDNALASGAGPVFVVVGHEAGEVAAALEGCAITLVDNPRFADGMASSLQSGFTAALASGEPGVLVLLGDMPLVGPDVIAAVGERAAADPGRIIDPRTGGTPAHPVWIPARLGDAIAALDGDCGARALVKSDRFPSIIINVAEDAAADIDTEEAYRGAIAKRERPV